MAMTAIEKFESIEREIDEQALQAIDVYDSITGAWTQAQLAALAALRAKINKMWQDLAPPE